MKEMLAIVKRYRIFLIILVINVSLLVVKPDIGKSAFALTGSSLLEMLTIIPPIFVLLGLLDVWVQRETMIRFMGEGSGIKGVIIAFILGSAAAGPLYAGFPLAAVMMKKGAKLSNIFVFVGAWSTTKIPLLLFETSNLGLSFMLLRLACNIVGILAIALIMEKSLTDEKRKQMINNAKSL